MRGNYWIHRRPYSWHRAITIYNNDSNQQSRIICTHIVHRVLCYDVIQWPYRIILCKYSHRYTGYPKAEYISHKYVVTFVWIRTLTNAITHILSRVILLKYATHLWKKSWFQGLAVNVKGSAFIILYIGYTNLGSMVISHFIMFITISIPKHVVDKVVNTYP